MTNVIPALNGSSMNSSWITDFLLDLANQTVNFSDIQIEQDRPVMLRMPSGWLALESSPPISHEDIGEFAETLDPEWQKTLRAKKPVSRAIDLYSSRLRISVYSTHAGESLTITVRRQPLRPIPLQETGLPMWVRKQAEMVKGLILVTGQTGAGKTTSLSSIVDYINITRRCHIQTIEDPIEFVHERKKSIFSQKEVGVDTASFTEGIKEAMRQKPDVIMIGEVRDRDTADAMFTAAESGHLVLASFHSTSATGAITKLLSWFPGEERMRAQSLAENLNCVICQSLIPSKDQSDRVLALELLVNNDAATENSLADPAKHGSLRSIMRARENKMSQTLNYDLVRLVREGIIADRDAARFTNDRFDLEKMLGSAS